VNNNLSLQSQMYIYNSNARQILQIGLNNSHMETQALEKNQLNYTQVKKNVNQTVSKDVEIVDAGTVL